MRWSIVGLGRARRAPPPPAFAHVRTCFCGASFLEGPPHLEPRSHVPSRNRCSRCALGVSFKTDQRRLAFPSKPTKGFSSERKRTQISALHLTGAKGRPRGRPPESQGGPPRQRHHTWHRRHLAVNGRGPHADVGVALGSKIRSPGMVGKPKTLAPTKTRPCQVLGF